MAAFADLQFYRINGRYLVKEFALVTEESQVVHYVFAPPPIIDWNHDDLKNNDWVYHYHHGLHWFSGFVPYQETLKKIANSLKRNDIFVIYVKGYEKMKFLEKFDVNVQNIENCGLVYKIKDVRNGISCLHHREKNNVCALRNVFHMKNCMSLAPLSVDPR